MERVTVLRRRRFFACGSKTMWSLLYIGGIACYFFVIHTGTVHGGSHELKRNTTQLRQTGNRHALEHARGGGRRAGRESVGGARCRGGRGLRERERRRLLLFQGPHRGQARGAQAIRDGLYRGGHGQQGQQARAWRKGAHHLALQQAGRGGRRERGGDPYPRHREARQEGHRPRRAHALPMQRVD